MPPENIVKISFTSFRIVNACLSFSHCFPVSLFSRDSGVVDHLSVHHRAHPQRQQQAVSLSSTSLSARVEYGENMSDRFTEGQDVLARWSDGLFYLGTITKVSVRENTAFLNVMSFLSFMQFPILKLLNLARVLGFLTIIETKAKWNTILSGTAVAVSLKLMKSL